MTPAPARAPAGAPPPWPAALLGVPARRAGRPLEGYGCGTTSPMLPNDAARRARRPGGADAALAGCSAGLHRSPYLVQSAFATRSSAASGVTGWSSPSTPSTSERPGRRPEETTRAQPTVATPTTAAEAARTPRRAAAAGRRRPRRPEPKLRDRATPWQMFRTHTRHEDGPLAGGGHPQLGLPGRSPAYADIAAVDRDAQTFTSDGVRQPRKRSTRTRSESAPPSWRWTASATAPCAASSSASSAQRASSTATRTSARPDRPDPGRRPAQGHFDFVQEISADFPINSARRLLDVPPEDSQQLIDWGSRIIGNTDPDYADVLLHGAEASSTATCRSARLPRSLRVRAGSWPAKRRGGDGTDIVSRLVNETPRDGVPLSAQDFDNYFPAAGRRRQPETTRHAMSPRHAGAAPAPRAAGPPAGRPVADPSATEVPALGLPVYHFRRTATRDVELGGKRASGGRQGRHVVRVRQP